MKLFAALVLMGLTVSGALADVASGTRVLVCQDTASHGIYGFSLRTAVGQPSGTWTAHMFNKRQLDMIVQNPSYARNATAGTATFSQNLMRFHSGRIRMDLVCGTERDPSNIPYLRALSTYQMR